MKKTKEQIQHVNFIEQKAFSLTYANMILIFVAGLLVIGSIIGIQKARIYGAEKKVAQLNNELALLRAENEKRAKSRAEQEESLAIADAQKELLRIFDTSFSWPQTLREMTVYINPSLWLTKIDSSGNVEGKGYGLSLRGRSLEAAAVTQLVKGLSQSNLFSDVILLSSKQTKEDSSLYYDFSIDLIARDTAKKEAP